MGTTEEVWMFEKFGIGKKWQFFLPPFLIKFAFCEVRGFVKFELRTLEFLSSFQN